MAIKTNTALTYSAVGNREDLTDVITNISPEETPFMANAGRGPAAEGIKMEWLQDSLADAADDNDQLEGQDYDSAGLAAVTPRVRVGNYCQIAAKTVIVSGTQDAVNKAGISGSELNYQVALRGRELKRDMEKGLLANKGAAAGNSTTARKTGAVLAWLFTNTNFDAATTPGEDPVHVGGIPTDTRTDGTQRSFTEDILKDVIAQCWSSGGKPTTIMLNAFLKGVFSGFAGIAEQRAMAPKRAQATIIGAADVYVSDFGELTAVPNRFMRTRDALVFDWDYWKISYLRPFKVQDLAKTGDASKKLLLAEYGLRCLHEASSGGAFDLTDS